MSVAYQSSTSSHFSPVRSRDYSPWMTSPEASLEDGSYASWDASEKSSSAFPSSSSSPTTYASSRHGSSSPSHAYSQPQPSSSDAAISPMILLYPSIPLILFLGTLAGAFV